MHPLGSQFNGAPDSTGQFPSTLCGPRPSYLSVKCGKLGCTGLPRRRGRSGQFSRGGVAATPCVADTVPAQRVILKSSRQKGKEAKHSMNIMLCVRFRSLLAQSSPSYAKPEPSNRHQRYTGWAAQVCLDGGAGRVSFSVAVCPPRPVSLTPFRRSVLLKSSRQK